MNNEKDIEIEQKNQTEAQQKECEKDEAAKTEQNEQPVEAANEKPKKKSSFEKKKEPSKEDVLKEELAQANDKILRNMAEFDNYKKRTAREKEELGAFCKAGCISEILPALDNFDRALTAECKDEDFKKGMEMIFSQIVGAIVKLGATEIEAIGKPFDPRFHNAIKQVTSDEFGENEVCEVLQKGYMLGDKVIRHAMVVVANP